MYNTIVLEGVVKRIDRGIAIVLVPKSWHTFGDVLQFKVGEGWAIGQPVTITVEAKCSNAGT